MVSEAIFGSPAGSRLSRRMLQSARFASYSFQPLTWQLSRILIAVVSSSIAACHSGGPA